MAHIARPTNVDHEAISQRRGLTVFVALVVLTVVEYIVAVSLDAVPLLVTLLAAAAVAKCWAITYYFMHIGRLWHGEGDHS